MSTISRPKNNVRHGTTVNPSKGKTTGHPMPAYFIDAKNGDVIRLTTPTGPGQRFMGCSDSPVSENVDLDQAHEQFVELNENQVADRVRNYR